MAMRRENVAAALKYLQDKANLRQRFERATSLDPQEQDLADIAVETGASFIPGVGQALAARDVERARRANDPAGMAMASMGAIPGGRLAGLLKRYDPVMQQLDVYHGTPHKFPATEANPLGEFDASKIGTGEGAQAYGHGVYLAESPGVATEYKNKLGRVVSSIDNKPTSDVYEEWAVSALKNFPEPEKAKAYFQNLVDVGLLQGKKENEIKSYVDSVNSAIDRAAGKQVGQTIGGSLYKADLPDEMIDRMLDWDAPIKSQPESVRAIVEPFMNKYGVARTADIGTLISAMERDMPSSMVSEKLREAGIPGIRYADAGSRGQGGTGTRNFVVFPGEEKKVRILERDGQKAPPQKIAQALEAAPRKPETAFDAPEVKPGDIVDGLKVRPEVANVGSIKASLDNYTVLPGIRSVSIADFGEAGPLTGNVDKLDRRTRNLADQITESKEITPLIVVYSGTQNYILEGSHRIDALDALGKKRIPVIAVIDEDDPPKVMRQKR